MENIQPPDLEHVWEFAGQGLKSSDFNTAMVHFYRAEVSRSNAWRARLDATTNWAVITTGASLTFAFGSPENSPVVLIFNTILIILFLFIEARRYRYYELWTNRVRIMEQNFYAGLLSPPFMPHAEWADKITASLNNPRFPIGLAEALGRRYRRNYAPIFIILAVSWIVKIAIHPTEVNSWTEFLERASFGPVSGIVVIAVGVVVHTLLVAGGIFTVGLRESTAEVVSDSSSGLVRMADKVRVATQEALEVELPRIRQFDNRKQVIYVISDHAQEVGKAMMENLKHGVTLLEGQGLYTGQPRGIIFCAIDAKQIKQLKKVVHSVDKDAFVVVTQASDVLGRGFRPLEA